MVSLNVYYPPITWLNRAYSYSRRIKRAIDDWRIADEVQAVDLKQPFFHGSTLIYPRFWFSLMGRINIEFRHQPVGFKLTTRTDNGENRGRSGGPNICPHNQHGGACFESTRNAVTRTSRKFSGSLLAPVFLKRKFSSTNQRTNGPKAARLPWVKLHEWRLFIRCSARPVPQISVWSFPSFLRFLSALPIIYLSSLIYSISCYSR